MPCNVNYRKIWSDVHGPIPVDSNGRSYEIHHKNGDHFDNRIENLEAVSIETHYQKHFEIGDLLSCNLIAHRAKMPIVRLFGEANGFYGKKHTKEAMERMVQSRMAHGSYHQDWAITGEGRKSLSNRMKNANPMKDQAICSAVQSKRVNTMKSFLYWYENQFKKIPNYQEVEHFIKSNFNLKPKDLRNFGVKFDFAQSIIKRFKTEYSASVGG